MELTNDFRLNSTPKILLIVCVVLLVARIGMSVFEFIHPVEHGRPVAWTDVSAFTPQIAEGKHLRLYEFYAQWCSPCARLERDVMTNSEIRSLIEKNFVTLRVTDRQREDGKNSKLVAELQKRYRVFAFPTLVAVADDGEPIGLLVGNSSSLAVYRFLSRVQTEGHAKK